MIPIGAIAKLAADRQTEAKRLLAGLAAQSGAIPSMMGAFTPDGFRRLGYSREEAAMNAQKAAAETAFQKEQELQKALQEAMLAKQAPAVSGKEAMIAGGISLLGGLLGARPQYTQGAFNQFIGGREQHAEQENAKRLAAAEMAYKTGMAGVDHQRQMSEFDVKRQGLYAGRAMDTADGMERSAAAAAKARADQAQWLREFNLKAGAAKTDAEMKQAAQVKDLLDVIRTANDRGTVHAAAAQLAQLGTRLPLNALNEAANAAEGRGLIPVQKLGLESKGLSLREQELQHRKDIDWAKYGLDQAKTNVAINESNAKLRQMETQGGPQGHAERKAVVDGVNAVLNPTLSAYQRADPEEKAALLSQAFTALRQGIDMLGPEHPAIKKAQAQLQAAGVSPDRIAAGVQGVFDYVTRPFEAALQGAVRNAPEGTPYVWGGQDMNKGVDCSGLVCEVFKEAGIHIPDTTAAGMFSDSKRFAPVNKDALRPGDLIFYYTDKKNPNRVSHVGIYAGKGMVKHASSSRGTVTDPMSNLKYPIAGYRRYKA
jgi:hypothetical protein